MNWDTSLLTIGHKNRASILNKDLCSWLCPDNGYNWHAEITTSLNLTGNNLSLSCLTLDVHGALKHNINPLSNSRIPFWKGLTYLVFLNSLGSTGVYSRTDKIPLMYLRSVTSDVACLYYSSVGRHIVEVSLIFTTCTITMIVSPLYFRSFVEVCPCCICTDISPVFIYAPLALAWWIPCHVLQAPLLPVS